MKAILSFFSYGVVIVLAIILGLVLAILSEVVSAPAHADTVQCAGIADMLAQLHTKYGEQPLFVGRASDGATVMIVANPARTTWTALIVGEAGKACIGAAGPSWSPGDPPGPQGTEG